MTTKLVRLLGDKEHTTESIRVEPLGGDRYRIAFENEVVEVDGFETERGVSFRLDGVSYDFPVERRGEHHRVSTPHGRLDFQLVDERVHKMRTALGVGAGGLTPELRSPMTGKIVMVKCAPGDQVTEGDSLVIIEAMKMENEIKAPGDAVVNAVRVAAGAVVAPGDVLVEFVVE